MADPVSNNLSLIEMVTGTASGTWGTILNSNMIALVDQVLGDNVAVTVGGSNINLTTAQRQHLAFNFTGTITNNINVALPLSPNSTTVAVGGIFVADNNSTGNFNITAITTAAGSVGVIVHQGKRTTLYSDGTNVKYADDAQNSLIPFNGNPTGSLAGNAAATATRADLVINRNTNETYLATKTGTAASAIWHKNLPYSFPSEGYLTLNSDATNPVVVADTTAGTVFLTAFRGDQVWVNNGTSFVPVTITGGQMSAVMNVAFQLANGIYDVMFFLDPADNATPRVGFSPAWATPTAGSGSRGAGAGTPQLQRVNGILVNAVSQTINNNLTTFAVAANRATYLGSVAIDGTAAQTTCHVTYGTSRKWGIWNAYNRLPIILKEGDSTASWTVSSNTLHASHSSTGNAVVTLVGLAEEKIALSFKQKADTSFGSGTYQLGIGANSVTVASGYNPDTMPGGSGGATVTFSYIAEYQSTVPLIGIQRFTALEAKSGNNATAYGTEQDMVLSATWNG